MSIDVARARADTPGCAHVAHFNNAGASLAPDPVLGRVIGHLQLEAQVGGYEAAMRRADELAAVYTSIARLVGAETDEIALTDSATTAWNNVCYSLAATFSAGDRILTSRAEYGSNVIALLQMAGHTGARIEIIPDDEHGQVSVDALHESLDERVKLVAITQVPTQGGLVNPVVEIGRVVRDTDAVYLVDACQSAGQLAIDVGDIGCDALSATGRKYVRGPRGTGWLFASRALVSRLEPTTLDLRSARWVAADRYEIADTARRFESFEAGIAGKLGLGAAVEYALGWGLDAIEARVTALGASLREQLVAIPGVDAHDLGVRKCGIVTFTVEGVEPDEVAVTLRSQGINVWVSLMEYARFDLEARALPKLVRASAHYYNTDDEVARLAAAVAAIAAR
jgi:cysteine desulfurase/selenocysteine lyase